MVFLKRPAFVLLFCAVLASGSATAQRRGEYALRAAATLDSLYACYSVPGTKLLRENYPDDASYKATYLAGESAGNPFSYLWPFSGTLSAVAALVETVGWEAYGPLLDTVVLPGLREYVDDRRRPFAYASYIASAPVSDRFYDDNIWLGIDFTDLYAATRQQRFLDEAERIWLFIASGTDDRLGGGIYWCEQKKESKNTCSNAPGAVFALKLYLATGREHYLEQGRALYEWTRRKLLDSSDNLYFDHISLKGPLNKTKYSYNSGQMIQAGADGKLTNLPTGARYTFNKNDVSDYHYGREAVHNILYTIANSKAMNGGMPGSRYLAKVEPYQKVIYAVDGVCGGLIAVLVILTIFRFRKKKEDNIKTV